MSNDSTFKMSQDLRDLVLLFTLANTIVNQEILQAIYTNSLGLSPQEAADNITKIRQASFESMLLNLAKHGELDIATIMKRLGLQFSPNAI